jgi:heat shock protein HslJ
MSTKKNILFTIGLFVIFVVCGMVFLMPEEKVDSVPESTLPTTEENQAKEEKLLLGMYKGETKDVDEQERIVTLTLSDDKKATWEIEYQNAKVPLSQAGTWTFGEDENRIEVNLNTKNMQPPEDDEKLIFKYDTTAGTLVLKEYDKSVWGKDGLDLVKTVDLVGTKWTWLETTLSDETEIQADNRYSFTLKFEENDTLTLTTDCHRAQANYKTDGIETMSIAATVMTMPLKFCENTQETDFISELNRVESFLLEGSSLRLMLKDDGGTMTFTQEKNK